ncbi:hypothetical protein GALL_445310 [mine drainage metagenome]|uniref:Uncharacterized protein n=1 Tax=mine drainage metagenome TaxID=410659 RepID=A0A1J5Q8L3_9ZZZZ
MCGNGVGQAARIIDSGNRRQDFWRNFLVQLDILIELRNHRATHGLGFRTGLGTRLDGHSFAGEEIAVVVDIERLGTLRAFDQNLHRAIRELEHLKDAGQAADLEQVVRLRLILGCRFLRHQHDLLARLHGRFKRLDRFGAPDKQRNHHMGENHDVAQRQQRQCAEVGILFRGI